MRGSCSGHVTSPLWLSLDKMNVRMRVLPGLLGLKLFRQGLSAAPCAWAEQQ